MLRTALLAGDTRDDPSIDNENSGTGIVVDVGVVLPLLVGWADEFWGLYTTGGGEDWSDERLLSEVEDLGESATGT